MADIRGSATITKERRLRKRDVLKTVSLVLLSSSTTIKAKGLEKLLNKKGAVFPEYLKEIFNEKYQFV